MDTDTFSKLFLSKNVKVSYGDGHIETGFIEEIGLAANLNASSREHLPVSIKVNSHTVSIISINLLAELKNRLKISIFLWRKSCASR